MFNKKSRIANSMKNSGLAITNQLVTAVLSFVYRTVFLMILSKEYLGINGLFSNVLSILSLAELGVGSAIIFRLYASVKNDDLAKTAALMNYYKVVYRVIALVVTCIGLAILPLIPFLIRDNATLPADINIYLIYSLFLAQSVTSYFFAYKQSLMTADQNSYILNRIGIVVSVIRNIVQLLTLFLTKNFTITLVVTIILQMAINYAISVFVTHKYKEVFRKKDKLSKQERRVILKETGGMLCHKVGGTIVLSTDSILLSAFIGAAVLGMYSNYSLIMTTVMGILYQLFGAMSASVGNLHVHKDIKAELSVYYRLQFLVYWCASFCTITTFVLINPFIEVWLGAEMLFGYDMVAVLCVSMFINILRCINGAFISSCGLFMRDKIRPFVEAGINLLVSILGVIYLGPFGIFLGTIIGMLVTVVWREPYLLFKYEFKTKQTKYWIMYITTAVLTVLVGAIVYYICSFIPNSWGYLVLKLAISLAVVNVIYAILFFKNEHFRYYIALLARIVKKITNKVFKRNKSAIADQDKNVEDNKPSRIEDTTGDNDEYDNNKTKSSDTEDSIGKK